MSHDDKDNTAAEAAIGMVVRSVREEQKHFIQLSQECPHYYLFSDGCEHDNRMGDECTTGNCPLG
jgi:hypothetical protein